MTPDPAGPQIIARVDRNEWVYFQEMFSGPQAYGGHFWLCVPQLPISAIFLEQLKVTTQGISQ